MMPGGMVSAQPRGAAGDYYQTRQSDSRYDPPPGHAHRTRRSYSGIRIDGYTAERVLVQTADATRLNGGEIEVCSEYGTIEIADSDDDRVSLRVWVNGFGEGAEQPGEAARRVIAETELRAVMTAHEGRLMVRVWHSTLGFTRPGRQPAWVNVRVLVPPRGAYHVGTIAIHGRVAVRRLTLAGATLRGAVGDKFKGIRGFLFGTELDDVLLAGNVDINNVERAIADLIALSAPIFATVRVASSCRLNAVTGGNIFIAVRPAPDLGVRALGESNGGAVRVGVYDGIARDTTPNAQFRIRRQVESIGFESKPIRCEVRAASQSGEVNVASVPAAPLAER